MIFVPFPSPVSIMLIVVSFSEGVLIVLRHEFYFSSWGSELPVPKLSRIIQMLCQLGVFEDAHLFWHKKKWDIVVVKSLVSEKNLAKKSSCGCQIQASGFRCMNFLMPKRTVKNRQRRRGKKPKNVSKFAFLK